MQRENNFPDSNASRNSCPTSIDRQFCVAGALTAWATVCALMAWGLKTTIWIMSPRPVAMSSGRCWCGCVAAAGRGSRCLGRGESKAVASLPQSVAAVLIIRMPGTPPLYMLSIYDVATFCLRRVKRASARSASQRGSGRARRARPPYRQLRRRANRAPIRIRRRQDAGEPGASC